MLVWPEVDDGNTFVERLTNSQRLVVSLHRGELQSRGNDMGLYARK